MHNICTLYHIIYLGLDVNRFQPNTQYTGHLQPWASRGPSAPLLRDNHNLSKHTLRNIHDTYNIIQQHRTMHQNAQVSDVPGSLWNVLLGCLCLEGNRQGPQRESPRATEFAPVEVPRTKSEEVRYGAVQKSGGHPQQLTKLRQLGLPMGQWLSPNDQRFCTQPLWPHWSRHLGARHWETLVPHRVEAVELHLLGSRSWTPHEATGYAQLSCDIQR